MGATGVCWDNAMAESFFAALKNELVHRTVFPTRGHARRQGSVIANVCPDFAPG
jgi:putative transposase